MKNLGPSYSKLVVLVSIVAAAIAFVALNPPKHSPFAASVAASEPDGEQVYVIFEGPWAIAQDPDHPDSVLAVAPRTKHHRPLGLVPANTSLDAGVYELQVPAHEAVKAPTFDEDILRADIDAQKVRRALSASSKRYAIRLPKPEAYLAETRFTSVVSSAYPKDLSGKKDYATALSLRYSVSSLSGFQLTGTKDDGGTFNPLLLRLDTPIVRFEIDPEEDLRTDTCNNHSRGTFHELGRLVGLTLYIDYPDDKDYCRERDPQKMRSGDAQLIHGLPARWPTDLTADIASPQEAGLAGGSLAGYFDFTPRELRQSLSAILFFFHTTFCRTPIIVANGTS